MGFCALALASLAISDSRRTKLNSLIMNHKTEVLSVINTTIKSNETLHIVKIRKKGVIYLEVYQDIEKSTLLDSVSLGDKYDSHFKLSNKMINLALVDIDGDKTLEILAPTIDFKLNAHLNVFKLNPITKSLEKINIVSGLDQHQASL